MGVFVGRIVGVAVTDGAGSDVVALAAGVPWWLLRPRREAFIIAAAVVFAVAWGLTHPPAPDFTPHDAYVMSVSPFDPHHVNGRYP